MRRLKEITLKNKDSNADRDDNRKVFEVVTTESVVTSPEVVEEYSLEKINQLIENTQKDIDQLQSLLVWANEVKSSIEGALSTPIEVDTPKKGS